MSPKDFHVMRSGFIRAGAIRALDPRRDRVREAGDGEVNYVSEFDGFMHPECSISPGFWRDKSLPQCVEALRADGGVGLNRLPCTEE
jgi:hypothetical protein